MKTKAHRRYYLQDKSLAVGVTTVLSILSKPALLKWSNNLGLSGIDVNKFVDDKAAQGTLAHLLIEDYLKKTKRDYLEDFTKNQLEQAKNAFNKFLEWEKDKVIEIMESELALVSEKHRYGGTIDLYCTINGRSTVMDIKTSKAVYSEHKTQVCAYAELLKENGFKVDEVRILRIGRDDGEGFEEIQVAFPDLHWNKFLHCLYIYDVNKKLKG